MRISTQALHTVAVNAMMEQQSQLSKLQNQVATGKRVQTPADDPVAAVHIAELERAQSESDQFGQNITMAKSRLTLEEQGIADVTTVMTRVRELVVQAANTGTLNDSDRASIATELASRVQELQDIANRKDGNGEYLFSGYSTQTQPFSRNAAGVVTYMGDVGNRVLQVGPTQRIQDSDSGADLFMNITQGNGTFVTAATAANTGTASIDVGSITNQASWVPDTYTITFTAPDTYQVTNSSGTVVAGPAAYGSGAAIAFNGVQVSVSGAPATGDTFTVSNATSQDVFKTLDGIVSALKQPAGTSAASAQLSTALAGALQQIDQANDHFSSVRSQVGTRLSLLDDTDNARQSLSVDLQTSLTDLRDLDYPSALAKLNQQLVGLQAAQQSYSLISQLSLFKYL